MTPRASKDDFKILIIGVVPVIGFFRSEFDSKITVGCKTGCGLSN